MNWKIGIGLWMQGVVLLSMAVFAICIIGCFTAGSPVVFLIGLVLLFMALFISLPSILIYSIWLFLARQLDISVKARFATMLAVPTLVSVGFALKFCIRLVGDDMPDIHSFGTIAFWLPLICCIVAVMLSKEDILEYLQSPDTVSKLLAD